MGYAFDRSGRRVAETNGAAVTFYGLADNGQVLSETNVGGTLDGWRIQHELDEYLRRTNTTVYFGATEQARTGFMYTNGSRLWQVRNGASTMVYDFQGGTPLVTRIEQNRDATGSV